MRFASEQSDEHPGGAAAPRQDATPAVPSPGRRLTLFLEDDSTQESTV